MQRTELALGDVVSIDLTLLSMSSFKGSGTATLVGVDREEGSQFPFLVAWNNDQTTLPTREHDNLTISTGDYLFPASEIRNKFSRSLWVRPECILAKQAKEKPCRQCQCVNDVGVKKCWWCEVPNPTPR